jgi:SH3-like domain-containing protein
MNAARVAAGGVLAALVCGAAPAPALALEYRAIGAEPAVLYDAPSAKAQKLFILGPGYPVEVLVTVEGWLKVRDATGELAWVEVNNLSSQRTVMVRVPRAEVRQAPDETAPVVFYAEQDVLLEFVEMAGNFAQVRHKDGVVGFVRVTQVWGL